MICYVMTYSSGERKGVEMLSLPSDTNCVAIATTFLNRAHQCHMTSHVTRDYQHSTCTKQHAGPPIDTPNHKLKGCRSDPIIDNKK